MIFPEEIALINQRYFIKHEICQKLVYVAVVTNTLVVSLSNYIKDEKYSVVKDIGMNQQQ